MTRSIHEHQWVYLGDLAITVTAKESDVSLRRLELCIECGTIRANFGSRWWVMEPEVTKEFLKKFDQVREGEIVVTPKEFRIQPPNRDARRLGRSLADILPRTRPVALPGDKS